MKPYLLVVLLSLSCLLVVDMTAANRHYPTAASPGNCGPQYDNLTCPNDECCSIWGGCGYNDSAFCAPDVCLPAYGVCWHYSPPPPPPSPPPSPGNCGPDYGDQVCPEGECCSKWGGCGYYNDPAYCAPDVCLPAYGVCWHYSPPPPPPSLLTPIGNCGPLYGDQVCPEGECCSKWGGCGYFNDPAYCSKENCLPDYGVCWPTSTPAAEMLVGDDHSLIRKVFDGLDVTS